MVALSLAPRALYEEVAEILRQRIFKRELEPGTWIDELKIAEEYGISRTPLREALKVLAAEGLVTMKVRRGAYVTEVADKLRLRGIPYIFVTGYEPPGGLKHRDVPVLRKPFTELELRSALLELWDD